MNSNKKKMVVILIAGGIVFFRIGKLLPSTQEQQPVERDRGIDR